MLVTDVCECRRFHGWNRSRGNFKTSKKRRRNIGGHVEFVNGRDAQNRKALSFVSRDHSGGDGTRVKPTDSLGTRRTVCRLPSTAAIRDAITSFRISRQFRRVNRIGTREFSFHDVHAAARTSAHSQCTVRVLTSNTLSTFATTSATTSATTRGFVQQRWRRVRSEKQLVRPDA